MQFRYSLTLNCCRHGHIHMSPAFLANSIRWSLRARGKAHIFEFFAFATSFRSRIVNWRRPPCVACCPAAVLNLNSVENVNLKFENRFFQQQVPISLRTKIKVDATAAAFAFSSAPADAVVSVGKNSVCCIVSRLTVTTLWALRLLSQVR